MNDNIIKMFIGGEEVVSNKEFTINEEMLSASSTILNNCYPASWEESKDYVSNFYYPKDYSKFILGKGNFTYGTEQYSILSVSGETFMQFTTNVEKEWNSFNVYGNTYQKTSVQGKNLFNYKLFDTFTTSVKFITISGLKASTDYTLSSNLPSANATVANLFLGLTTSLSSGSNGVFPNAPRTINTGDSTSLIIGYRDNNNTLTDEATSYWYQLEESSTATEYEAFTPNMPSPEYPSELVSVGYENLLKPSATNNGVDINIIRTSLSFNQDTFIFTATGSDMYWGVADSSGATYSDSHGQLIPVNEGDIINLYISNPNFTKNYISRWGSDKKSKGFTQISSNIATYTVPSGISYITLRIGIGSSTAGTTYETKIMISKGTQAHSYIPYGKYGIEVKTTGKNLFDANNYNLLNAYYVDGTGKVVYGNNNRLTWLKLQPNTTYTLTQTKVSNVNRRVALFSSQPVANLQGTLLGTFSGANPINQTFTTNDTNVYLGWVYCNLANLGSYTEQEMADSIQVEQGNTATDYEEYKSNTYLYQLNEPLRSIGDFKDKLYIRNGYLYVERQIGSVVLNGSEKWGYGGTSGVFYITSVIDYATSNNIPNSNYYKGVINVVGAGAMVTNNTIAFINQSGLTIPRLYIKDDRYTNNTNDFKTWLSTHNTEVQYLLEEPYTESIGQVNIPYSYEGINNTIFGTGIDTEETIYYYWKNYDVSFAGIVKNSGDISLRPTNPKYCSLQILDYKTFLSESDTLDFVISDKTIAEAITMVVDAISGYGFVLGTIDISQADDIIGAYSTLNKTAYDVFQYLANISGSRWRARFVDSDTMAIDFYDPELLPRANDIDYTQQYWEDNKIVDLTFNYGTRDYRNKQIILSDEVYGGIDYTEVLLSNGYGTSYITQNNIANITSITVNGVEAEVITQSEKDLGVDADFYYTPGKNVVESTISYTAGTQIIITYTPLVKGRQIVYNDEEVTRIATQTNTTGIISRYENRNDILSSDELENIAESYIKYKGKPEIILKLTTLNNDLFNIGEICYFNSPIADLAQDYMVKSKATNYTSVAGETNIFYTYELTSSFNSEKAINYFDNQRNKATGNIAEGESITRNIDINNSAMIIWENATITEISVSVDGDNALNSVLNSPFIQ